MTKTIGNLSHAMNLKFGNVDGAYVIKNVNLGLAAYAMIYVICTDLNINLTNISKYGFDSAAYVLDDFAKSANDYTGYTVSVWFD